MWQLDAIVLIPLAGALVAAMNATRARLVALAVTLANITVLLSLAPSGVFAGEAVHGLFSPQEAGTMWLLTIDGLSLPFVVLTMLLGIVATLASWEVASRPSAHHALLLGLQSAVLGVFLAEHVLLFYVFWEAVLIPMFFLIGRWGYEGRRQAAVKFFLYTFAGSVFMLIGLLIAIMSLGAVTFTALAQAAGGSAGAGFDQALVFALLGIGLLVKLPAVPFHTWLPDAHVQAPTAGSIMLAGILLKMGGYGLIRLAIPIAPQGWETLAPFLLGLGIVGVVFGAAMALVQDDLKRVVAYSSISHMGFVLVALSVGTETAISAAILVMVSHGLVAGLLFYLVGELYERTHTRELASLGGMSSLTPRLAWSLAFAAFASLGLPGLSGFPGELLAVIEGFRSWSWWIAPIGIGLILAAAYNLRVVAKVNHGASPTSLASIPDLGLRPMLGVALLALPILIIGVWPRTVADLSAPAVQRIIELAMRGVSP